jgi:hypothetical protein
VVCRGWASAHPLRQAPKARQIRPPGELFFAVWIEQRIKEELETKPDNGKSLRTIGKEIAEEIERIFQTKVDPHTIRMKASRMEAGTNVPPDENPPHPGGEAGDSGDSGDNSPELTPQEIVTQVNELVKRLVHLYHPTKTRPSRGMRVGTVGTTRRSWPAARALCPGRDPRRQGGSPSVAIGKDRRAPLASKWWSFGGLEETNEKGLTVFLL